jgi:hypothetical protein
MAGKDGCANATAKAQALPGFSVETLKNMNSASQKYATWIVRVVQGRVVRYSFWSRGEKVEASKFQCVLVSSNPREYMLGVVPFSFAAPQAPAAAARKFLDGTCWEVTTPAFESSQKVEYNSCPVKTSVKLGPPSGLRAVTPVETEKYNYAAQFIHPSCTLAQALSILNNQARFQATPARAGSPGSASGVASKLVDLSFKIRSAGPERSVTKGGTARKVMNLLVVDDSTMPDGKQAQVEVGIWDAAIANVPGEGAGCCVVGCTVTKENDGCKINIWDSAFWTFTGDRAQSLTGLQAATDEESITTLTVAFTPAARPVDTSGAATPTCCVKLASVENDVLVEGEDLTFQINRGYFEASASSREDIYTKGGNLFLRASLWDWTGQCDVDVLEDAVPILFGLATKEEVEARLWQPELGGLVVDPVRKNVRGVIRLHQGVAKKLINEITASPMDARVSGDALLSIRGLSDSMGSVVTVAPADRVCDCPVLGMAALSDTGLLLPARRIVMLVTGTEASELKPLPAKPGSASSAFLVESADVQCELGSTEHGTISLRGYCGFHNMLAFRLDKESAVVIVSAVDGTAVPKKGHLALSVESMHKVSTANLQEVAKSMTTEWRAALGQPLFTANPLSNSEYWGSGNTMKRLGRLASEALSPIKKSIASEPPSPT